MRAHLLLVRAHQPDVRADRSLLPQLQEFDDSEVRAHTSPVRAHLDLCGRTTNLCGDVFIIHRLFALIPLVLIVDLGSFELFSCGFDVFGALVVFCRF